MRKLPLTDGFAVINVDTTDLLFSGSFKKCIEFIFANKAIVFSEGLAVVSAECARNIIDANSIIL
jgi:hypothetical protein